MLQTIIHLQHRHYLILLVSGHLKGNIKKTNRALLKKNEHTQKTKKQEFTTSVEKSKHTNKSGVILHFFDVKTSCFKNDKRR